MEEYMVQIWGGAWNPDATPSIEKDLGIKEGTYYFKTEKEKDEFVKKISQSKYKKQGMVIDTKYGIMTHKRTVFVSILFVENMAMSFLNCGVETKSL